MPIKSNNIATFILLEVLQKDEPNWSNRNITPFFREEDCPRRDINIDSP